MNENPIVTLFIFCLPHVTSVTYTVHSKMNSIIYTNPLKIQQFYNCALLYCFCFFFFVLNKDTLNVSLFALCKDSYAILNVFIFIFS